MLFRKSLYEIKSEYKEANMKNENFEMYHEVEKVLANKIERTDKVEKQYNRQERNKKYYEKRTEKSLVKAMQTYKAKNMMNFLSDKHSELRVLGEDDISKPLISLKNNVEERIHPEHD